MNAHPFPLTATVATHLAATGLHFATVETGMTESPFLMVGYLNRAEAEEAGKRFAVAMGRRPILAADIDAKPVPLPREAARVPSRIWRHGDPRRQSRRHVRAAKAAWLESSL